MLAELIELNLFAFFLIFARVGTAISMMPGFSSSFVSPRFALAIALGVCFVLTPMLSARLPVLPNSVMAMAILLIGEIIIGAFFGTLARIMMGALQTTGTIIAYTAAMANAMINDAISEQQSSTVASFLMTSGLVLIFVTDMHHLMIAAVIDSYGLFAPGATPMFEDFANFLSQRLTKSFALALQLSAPFIIVALTYYIGLGILGRLMPTLQVFFFGMPFQIAMSIWVLTISFSGIMLVFIRDFEQAFTSFVF